MSQYTVAVRAWQLLQEMERAYLNSDYVKASALADMARTYQSFPSTTDDDLMTGWFSIAVDPSNTSLGVILTPQLVTAATPPTDAEVSWAIADGRSTTVTNKELTSNIAKLTLAGAHRLVVGQKVTVAGVGAPFDGAAVTITAVTTNTFSYAVTNANIAVVASAGTITQVGATSLTTSFAIAGQYSVTMTVDTAALAAVAFQRYVKVPVGS